MVKQSDSKLAALFDLLEAQAKKHPETAAALFVAYQKINQLIITHPASQKISKNLKTLQKHWMQAFDNFDEDGYSENFIELIRPILQFFYYNYFRVDVVGSQHIPKRNKALIIPNHSGVLPYDGAMLSLAIFNELAKARMPRFLIDDFIFNFAILGKTLQRIGGVRASHHNAERLLKQGHLVINFPEGTKGVGKPYDERYQLKRFGRGGFVKLAIKTKTSIVPTAVIGAEEIHPLIWKSETLAKPMGIPYLPITPTFPLLGPLGMIPLPTKWKIIFGRPISFAKAKASAAKDEQFIESKSAEIKDIIQKMLDKHLKQRTSIWY